MNKSPGLRSERGHPGRKDSKSQYFAACSGQMSTPTVYKDRRRQTMGPFQGVVAKLRAETCQNHGLVAVTA